MAVRPRGLLGQPKVDAVLLVSDRALGRNNVEVCRSTPVADLMANLEAFPIIFD